MISQQELRDSVGDVLRRVAAGEEFVITLDGSPVAELRATARRRWVSGPALGAVFHTPPSEILADDPRGLPAALADPFD